MCWDTAVKSRPSIPILKLKAIIVYVLPHLQSTINLSPNHAVPKGPVYWEYTSGWLPLSLVPFGNHRQPHGSVLAWNITLLDSWYRAGLSYLADLASRYRIIKSNPFPPGRQRSRTEWDGWLSATLAESFNLLFRLEILTTGLFGRDNAGQMPAFPDLRDWRNSP